MDVDAVVDVAVAAVVEDSLFPPHASPQLLPLHHLPHHLLPPSQYNQAQRHALHRPNVINLQLQHHLLQRLTYHLHHHLLQLLPLQIHRLSQ